MDNLSHDSDATNILLGRTRDGDRLEYIHKEER